MVVTMGQSGSTTELLRCLPRNLSYAEDSILDNFSVSKQYVTNKLQLSGQSKPPHITVDTLNNEVILGDDCEPAGDLGMETMNGSDSAKVSKPANDDHQISESLGVECSGGSFLGEVLSSNLHNIKQIGSPSSISSEEFEEGVFMDMMEDMESAEDCDDFSIDSINSPECYPGTLHSSDVSGSLNMIPLQDAVNKCFELQNTVVVSQLEVSRHFVTSLNISERRQANLCLNVDNHLISSIPHGDSDEESCPATPVKSDSPSYGDDEFEFTRPVLRKSSSLKTTKTPPGTPHRKKVVRFADVMGLDLESVKHIINRDSPPRIPSSALDDLREGIKEDRKEQGKMYICATFSQPSIDPHFLDWVVSGKICLENTIVNDLSIIGFVRVANIGYTKVVRVRYTTNNWVTYYDIAASYIQNSCNGRTDRFSFSLCAPPEFTVGCRLELAISYLVNAVTYWDSNQGRNYVFECYAKSIPMENDTWLHFL